MNKLTNLEMQRAKFINDFIHENDNFPTCRQISKDLRMSKASALNLVKALAKKGWIEKQVNANSYKRTESMKLRMIEL